MIVTEIAMTVIGEAKLVLRKEEPNKTVSYAVTLMRMAEPHNLVLSHTDGLTLPQARRVEEAVKAALLFDVVDETTS